MNSKLQTSLYRSILYLALLGSWAIPRNAAATPRDSIGVEIENGQKIIVHRLEAKETYFGLSRRYGIPVKDIITANKNKPLKVGDIIRIPAGAAPAASSTGSTTSENNSAPELVPDLQPGEYTQYKVGQGETLFTISKRFVISVETIKRANGLTSDQIKAGTILKVPHNEIPPPAPRVSDVFVTDSAMTDSAAAVNIPPNRFGLHEATEKGIGVWIDDFTQGSGSMLALHRVLPVGTVIKITNPMTGRTALVKVVGKFADNAETKDAIIVISKSAASLIGVLDRRFQVEISYGAPNESN